jgi:hypothetical protein
LFTAAVTIAVVSWFLRVLDLHMTGTEKIIGNSQLRLLYVNVSSVGYFKIGQEYAFDISQGYVFRSKRLQTAE